MTNPYPTPTRSTEHLDRPATDGHTLIVCQTCNLTLNRLTTDDDPTTLTWVHTRSWEPQDHEPIPTTLTVDNPYQHADCDFCGNTTTLTWSYQGQHLQLRGGPTTRDYGTNWAACQPCADIIQTRNLTTLAQRCLRHSAIARTTTNPHDKQRLTDQWIHMWTLLFANGLHRTWIGPQPDPPKLHPRHMPKYLQGLLRFWQHPALHHNPNTPTPQQLPGFCYDTDDFLHNPTTGHTTQALTRLTTHITTQLTNTHLYWIADNYTQLAILAGQEFTDIILNPEQLPTPNGFVIYAQPITTIHHNNTDTDIRAFTWTTIPGGIWITIYFQTENTPGNHNTNNIRQQTGYFLAPNPGTALPYSQPITIPNTPQSRHLRTIVATLIFLTQPGVADTTELPPDKKHARAHQRTHGTKPPTVHLISLRKTTRTNTTKTTGPRGPLKWLRYTPGHWRHQPYGPQRSQTKLLYISQYLSGNHDAGFNPNKPPTVKILK